MTKICVGIIFGGKSTEHKISLQSAKNIICEIDKSRFDIVLLSIDKHGYWYINDTNSYIVNNKNSLCTSFSYPKTNVAVIPGHKKGRLISVKDAQILLTQVDVIFPVIHGMFGEDGSLQGMLRMVNLPFVGSDVSGSVVCMDKDITKRLLRDAGLKVAPFIALTHTNYNKYNFEDFSIHLGLPLFVKPANHGSSIGVSKVYSKEQFINAVNLAFAFDRKIIIETNIEGREIECAILGNDSPQASVCAEIIVKDGFYSYDKKYLNKGDTRIVIPAVLDLSINDIIRKMAIAAYQALGCQGMARVDVFLTNEGEVVINEVNTLPGFTDNSTYPRLWQASGVSYSALISRLVELAMERYETNLSYIS